MFYVYVLKSSKDNNFYIGYTGDLKRRIGEHNSGRTISTSPRRPLDLVFYEAHLNPQDAQRRERYFKTTKGKSTLKLMLRNYISKSLQKSSK